MSLSTLRRRELVLTNQTRTIQQEIGSLIQKVINDEIGIHPKYNRQPKWSQSQYSEYINSKMTNGIIPGIVLYKYQPGDIRMLPTHNSECFDGQNRLSCDLHYFKGIPIISNKSTFMIYWYHAETETYVFYDKTPDTEAWALKYDDRRVGYMTSEEKSQFNGFGIDVKYIENPMSFETRCREFAKLQNGTKVTGSDLFKNIIDIPIIHFMMVQGFEYRFSKIFSSSLTVNHSEYWTQNFIRMFLLTISNETEHRNILLLNDKEISRLIKKKSVKLTNLMDGFEVFESKVKEVNTLLTEYLPDVKLPPTYFHTLFACLFTSENNMSLNVLSQFVRKWVKSCPKDDLKLWQAPKTIERLPFLIDRCILDIEQHFDTILYGNVPEIEKPVSSYARLEIWNRDHGDNEKVDCPMGCGRQMTKRRHHCAHRIARANGGSNEPDNLISTCVSCNLEMGTMSTDEWREIVTGSSD